VSVACLGRSLLAGPDGSWLFYATPMRALELLSGLTDNDIDWLLKSGDERQIIASTMLTTEGESNDDLILVLDGLLEVRVGGSFERQIAVLGPGELVGEMQLVGEPAAAATVLALENSLVLIIDRAQLEVELASNPEFASRLHRTVAQMLARRLKQANAHLRAKGAQSASNERVDGSAWGTIGPAVEAFKELVQDADRHAIRNHGEFLTEHVDAINQGFRAFTVLLNETIGDQSGLPEAERDAVGAQVQRELLPYLLLTELGERIYAKPRGYAGDFLTIDIIYRDQPSGAGRLGPLLDAAIYNEPAVRAVQGRRSLLATAIRNEVERADGEQARVMSLASGPAAEIFDVLEELDDSSVLVASCLDIDLQALAFVGDRAERSGLSSRFTLHHANLLYLATGRRQLDVPPQNLIYSIGLIDYFNDRFVIKLLDFVYDQLVLGGRVILGNFHPRNDCKAYMDHITDWKLTHRDEKDMDRLFEASKFGTSATDIQFEPEGINLFAECIKR